jgi:hypothetical protein
MKQYITVEQLNELSERGKERLKKIFKLREGSWFTHNGEDSCLGSYEHNEGYSSIYSTGCGCCSHEIEMENCLPLPSIGQMIEFLQISLFPETLYSEFTIKIHHKKRKILRGLPKSSSLRHPYWVTYRQGGNFIGYEELCDALWGEVKEALER